MNKIKLVLRLMTCQKNNIKSYGVNVKLRMLMPKLDNNRIFGEAREVKKSRVKNV